MAQQIAVEIVERYPYVEYMKYLLAGSVALARYVAVMIGGGMLLLMMGARGSRHVWRLERLAVLFPSGPFLLSRDYPSLQVIAQIDPFTYAVMASRPFFSRTAVFTAIRFDLLFLVSFGIAALALATPLFKRTL